MEIGENLMAVIMVGFAVTAFLGFIYLIGKD